MAAPTRVIFALSTDHDDTGVKCVSKDVKTVVEFIRSNIKATVTERRKHAYAGVLELITTRSGERQWTLVSTYDYHDDAFIVYNKREYTTYDYIEWYESGNTVEEPLDEKKVWKESTVGLRTAGLESFFAKYVPFSEPPIPVPNWVMEDRALSALRNGGFIVVHGTAMPAGMRTSFYYLEMPSGLEPNRKTRYRDLPWQIGYASKEKQEEHSKRAAAVREVANEKNIMLTIPVRTAYCHDSYPLPDPEKLVFSDLQVTTHLAKKAGVLWLDELGNQATQLDKDHVLLEAKTSSLKSLLDLKEVALPDVTRYEKDGRTGWLLTTMGFDKLRAAFNTIYWLESAKEKPEIEQLRKRVLTAVHYASLLGRMVIPEPVKLVDYIDMLSRWK